MPIVDSDPRVFFAAERTLLAWLRTGITIIALGFVVARFGLFLELFSVQSQTPVHSAQAALSAGLGVAFVIAGSLAMVVASMQHRRFIATLQPVDLPPAYSRGLAIALALFIGALGLVLAAYLLLT